MLLDLEFQTIDRRQPIRPQVYDALRDAVVRLRLNPGQQLSENEIAQQIGVSRTPVGEALIQDFLDIPPPWSPSRQGTAPPPQGSRGAEEMEPKSRPAIAARLR